MKEIKIATMTNQHMPAPVEITYDGSYVYMVCGDHRKNIGMAINMDDAREVAWNIKSSDTAIEWVEFDYDRQVRPYTTLFIDTHK